MRYRNKLALVLAAYFLTAKLGLSLDALSGVAATVWPPSGIALSALLLGGYSLWPSIALGALLANLSAGVPAAAAAGIMAGNTLEALAGAFLARLFGRLRGARLETVRGALALIGPAALASTAISASVGATSAWLGGVVRGGGFGQVWLNWWVGDVLGVLLVTPLVLALPALREQDWTRQRLVEAAGALTFLFTTGALIFGTPQSGWAAPRAYFVFPPLIWAALRFGQSGGAIATFVLASMAVLGTAAGLGPFVLETRAESLLALQTFMGSVAVTILVLGAVSTERARESADRKQLEAQLVIADRLAAVGTLAAGVGHEINNPLSYLMMNLDAARRLLERRGRPEAEAELGELLGTAREGAERIRHIVGDLRTLARDEAEARGPVDVRRVLDACAQIAENQIRHRARLVKEYGPVPPVSANEGRLAQVFLNLLVNAAQAITEGRADDNTIRVVTRLDAGFVVIEISDTGVGIEPALQRRLFEPFFTTKPIGAGTGLGLSVCHAIVTSIEGSITVRSEPGAGATFRVALPALDAPEPASPPAPIEAPSGAPRDVPNEASREGTPLRILIVEDEKPIARSLARLLGGHHVTLASSGREAVTLWSERDYDFVLCDLLMPELTGMDVYDEIRRVRPGSEQRMVFMTGGAFTARAQAFLATVPNRTLLKPFAPDELLRLVAASAAAPARVSEGPRAPPSGAGDTGRDDSGRSQRSR